MLVSSLIAGAGSYADAEAKIHADLNRALAQTLAYKGGELISNDTISACRQMQQVSSGSVSMMISDDYFSRCLSIPQLRDRAFISLCLVSDRNAVDIDGKLSATICGDTILLKPSSTAITNVSVALRGYADCSFAMVFSMSDQRVPLLLSLASMLWLTFSLVRFRNRQNSLQPVTVAAGITEWGSADRQKSMTSVGDMKFDDDNDVFVSSFGKEISFTPMQSELMKMFFMSATHRLEKKEICDALWHGKDNASESLYTMMRRLKPVVEQNSNLKIVVDRGKAYRLIIRE